jgi:hypothetical protein
MLERSPKLALFVDDARNVHQQIGGCNDEEDEKGRNGRAG